MYPWFLFLMILDTMVSTGCCATLDNIVTYLFKKLTKKQKKPHPNHIQDSEAFLRILELHPDILQQVLDMKCIMFCVDMVSCYKGRMVHDM